MKRIVVFICFLFIISAMFTACGYFENTNTLDAKESVLQEILGALSGNDKQALKSMFSEAALAEAKDFDENLDYLFEFFNGTTQTYTLKGAQSFEEKHDGARSTQLQASYYVTTDQNTYLLLFYSCLDDTENPGNVGLYTLRLILADNEDVEFSSWEEIKIPGIYRAKETAASSDEPFIPVVGTFSLTEYQQEVDKHTVAHNVGEVPDTLTAIDKVRALWLELHHMNIRKSNIAIDYDSLGACWHIYYHLSPGVTDDVLHAIVHKNGTAAVWID